MNKLPKMRTQEDAQAEQVEKIKSGGERGLLFAMLSALTGSGTRGLPVTDDHDKLARDALEDFRRNDFSEAWETVDSLVLIVDYYKNLAEEYLSTLTDYAIAVDECGNVANYPFVLMRGNEQVLGAVEVLEISEHEKSDLWGCYVKPHLPFATKLEREWIADEFSEFISGEDESPEGLT